MNVGNIRYLYQLARSGKPREVYWALAKPRATRLELRNPKHAVFARYVASEARHLSEALAGTGEESPSIAARLTAAVAWVLRAQAVTPDDGVSRGYFPLESERAWEASYPETTGYLISSLLAYADRYGREEVRAAALAMADWEIAVQMPNGAVQGGVLVTPDKQTPAAFNTGMVLDGWCSAYEASGARRFLEAGAAAARFLAADMDEAGYFKTSGEFVTGHETKTYNCLCAWAMLRLARLAADAVLEEAALHAVEAALRRQRDNGWFAHNCLSLSAIPLTHTLGYTLQGLFETGVLAGRSDFVAAAELGLAGVLRQMKPNGFLAGRFDEQWRPASNSVCLTGSCQLAVVAYRFAQALNKKDFVPAADRLMSFVKATQRLDGEDPGITGAIAGSYPIFGEYISAGFPNWAAKYFIDSLLLRAAIEP